MLRTTITENLDYAMKVLTKPYMFEGGLAYGRRTVSNFREKSW